jgi:hypothetical protein
MLLVVRRADRDAGSHRASDRATNLARCRRRCDHARAHKAASKGDVMKHHRLCKSTTVVRGRVLRCQQLAGHFSAHCCEHYWWANEKGLPIKIQRGKRKTLWQRLFKS